MVVRSVGVHLGIFLLASSVAYRAWTTEAADDSARGIAGKIWEGTADQVEAVSFVSKVAQVRLVRHQDEEGAYYVGRFEKQSTKPAANPHTSTPSPSADGKKVSGAFIAVEQATALVDKLAPLHAFRVLGKLEEGRKAEFGFDSDQGTIGVTIAGESQSLRVGDSTPGGTDRYVSDVGSGQVYVIDGSVVRDLIGGDSRLLQRQLHAFSLEDVTRVKLHASDATAEYIRFEGKGEFWSTLGSAYRKNETASNWMAKIQRLVASSYVEVPEPQAVSGAPIFTLEYFVGTKKVGFVELRRIPGETAGQFEFLARSETSRWYALVLRSIAEQVSADVQSLLGGQ